MPLTKASLSASIQAKVQALFGAPEEGGEVWLQNFADAVAEAVVQEIQSNALVTGAVTSGAGGTVTGTVS